MNSQPTDESKVEMVDVVDDDDRVIGSKPRENLEDATDRWRNVGLCVVNTSSTSILLARRSPHKRWNPRRWTTCVLGTVSAGESYDDAIQRETLEELGVEIIPARLEILCTLKVDARSEHRWLRFYGLVADLNPVTLAWDRSESTEVRWWNISILHDAVSLHPEQFTPGMSAVVERMVQ